MAMSVAPESGRNRIMIYGPENDGTYILEFKTAGIPEKRMNKLAPFTLALAAASRERNPLLPSCAAGASIVLRQGARVVHDGRRPRVVKPSPDWAPTELTYSSHRR
jgi:hypothetical protein